MLIYENSAECIRYMTKVSSTKAKMMHLLGSLQNVFSLLCIKSSITRV